MLSLNTNWEKQKAVLDNVTTNNILYETLISYFKMFKIDIKPYEPLDPNHLTWLRLDPKPTTFELSLGEGVNLNSFIYVNLNQEDPEYSNTCRIIDGDIRHEISIHLRLMVNSNKDNISHSWIEINIRDGLVYIQEILHSGQSIGFIDLIPGTSIEDTIVKTIMYMLSFEYQNTLCSNY